MRTIVSILVLAILITACTPVDVQAIYDAKADNERARAAAEWARTSQVQAEAAAEASQAQSRAQAKTASMVATWVILVITLAGLGGALIAWAWMRARLIFADKTGLYPVVAGQVAATSLNEPGAQLARIAPQRSPYQVLPPEEVDVIPAIPAPIELDVRQLQHIERLLLPPPGSAQHDTE